MVSCPDQFNQDSVLNVCTLITNLILSIDFSSTLNLATLSGLTVGNSGLNYYTNTDSNDPSPAINRGYYFNSNRVLTSPGYRVAPFFTLVFWVYPTNSGRLFAKTASSIFYVRLGIDSSGRAVIDLALNDGSTLLITAPVNLFGQ